MVIKGKTIKESEQTMGMAASQVRLLQLTSRKNDIGRTLSSLSLQKNSLSRDMKRVTKEYQEALNSKVLKWSNNSGVSYVDLSYKNLMTPSSVNQNTPYLITDSNGKVVIDSKYEDYAKMIDNNSGKYDDNVRAKILSGLISDVSESDITNANSTSAAKTAAEENYDNILAAEPQKSDKEYKAEEKGDATTLAGLCGTFSTTTGSTTKEYDLKSLYSSSSTVDLGDSSTAYSTLQNLTNMIADNMSRYLDGNDETLFKEECANFLDTNKYLFDTDESTKKTAENGASGGIKLTSGKYTINVREMFDSILKNYRDDGGSYTQNSTTSTGSNGIVYTYSDKDSDAYINWYNDHEAWKTELAAAEAERNSATDTDNQALTSEQEQQIAFYDQLFTAVADNGWTCDSQVSDNDYLNQMMQNGLYSITTMSEEEGEDSYGNEYNYYEYSTSPAVNFDKVFQVNDTDAQEEAQVNYEYEKSVINEKETRIDTRMQDLETEQSAIKTMLEGIQSVENDNIDRTMNFCA